MLIEHRGARPAVDPSAWVAPTAALVGDVRVGPHSRVLWHSVLTAEDGRIEIGARCVIMEQALIRGRGTHPVTLGDDVLIGPHAHVNGARLGDEVFIATGAGVFPGAVLGSGVTVAINGIVHVNSELAPGERVPIGWIALGSPAELYSPDRNEEIRARLTELDFFTTVYGVPREAGATERMRRQAEWFGAHRDDRVL